MPQAHASANFSVSNEVTYTIAENGLTHATFKISLKNKTSKYYASSYRLNVGFEKISNLVAKDSNGNVKTKIYPSSGGNSIEFILDDKIVGKDKASVFDLSFDTPDIVQSQGNVWELNIPGISSKDEFEDFNVKVIVPKSFGEPTFIKPGIHILKDTSNLTFSKEDLGHSGISLAFGTAQVYEFNLLYHLKNQNFFPISQTIALPPSTNYQQVYYDSLKPAPKQVTIDQDGNWLAEYHLSPGETLDIRAIGNAQISLYPQKTPLTEKELASYLENKPYWESHNKDLESLAKELKTSQNIYKYVVEHLTYDFSRVSANKPRLGALSVFKANSSAVCLEFTDLFVALSRAAGIPAREVDGYAYTQNSIQRPLSKTKDILHAWPEYYDRELESWIMVDPTWGNTTGGVDYFNILDFDHFAFVKRGIQSEYPIPAGGYKLSGGENTKDIQIQLSKNIPKPNYHIDVSSSIPNSFTAGLAIEGNIIIQNKGNTLVPSQKIHLSTTSLDPMSQDITVPEIPPFGYKTIPFSYPSTQFLTNRDDTLTITVGNKKTTYELHIVPFAFSKKLIVITGGIISVIFAIIISIIAKRTRRI